MNKTLTICIPTYNRKEVLINEVKDYLSVNDDRFIVKVSDNCSTDGTQDALKEINDNRLIVNYNSENLGSIPNWIKALSNNMSDYLFFILDKDIIDTSKLVGFLDFLDCEKPFFGYVDLDVSKPENIEYFDAGYPNIFKMAYLDKHPSGYFYKREIFEEAITKDSFLMLDNKFDFPFEVINAEIALKYPSVIVKGGLVTIANRRTDVKEGKTLSYDESNIWYGKQKRIIEYSYYFTSAIKLNLSQKQLETLVCKLTESAVKNVTVVLRSTMKNEVACSHYNVKKRDVSFFEMMKNALYVIKVFNKKAIPRMTFYARGKIVIKVMTKSILRIIKALL